MRGGAGLLTLRVTPVRKLRRTLRWCRSLFLSDREACLWWCFILLGCAGYVVSLFMPLLRQALGAR